MKIRIDLKGHLKDHCSSTELNLKSNTSIQDVLDLLKISHLTSLCLVNEEVVGRTYSLKNNDRVIFYGIIGAG